MALNTSIRPARLSAALMAAALLGAPQPVRAGIYDQAIEAFEDNPDYVQPFATLFGSMSNSGWYQSSKVASIFGFYLGLPLNLTYLAEADRTFEATFTDDGCTAAKQMKPGTTCTETTKFDAPTIFGRERAPTMKRSVINSSGDIIDTLNIPFSDGVSDMAAFNWLPFGALQAGVSFMNTEVKARILPAPLPVFSVMMYGAGIQHDLSSFLPVIPVSLSVAGNATWLKAEWEPGEGIDGKLELDGFSWFTGILVGYSFLGMLEVFGEAGWEGASLKAGGKLTLTDETPVEEVTPNLSIDGRNGFRAAVNVAFHLGYHAIIGQNMGANLGHQVGVMGFKL